MLVCGVGLSLEERRFRMRNAFRMMAGLLAFCCVVTLLATAAADEAKVPEAQRIENWTGKTVLVFTPHPDDDTFGCGGIMAILAKNDNKVIVVVYTNGNKGSRDLDMTRERMAQIRKAEEEAACAVLGIPKEDIIWLGYEDGDLEYADPQRLRGEAAKLIKQYRPDAVFSVAPGAPYTRWIKTDHRMAAFITKDAFIAAEWHLYYPEQWLVDGLKPYRVPVAYYYYAVEPDYTVDISDVIDKKMEAATKHVSQFPPSVDKYTPEMPENTLRTMMDFGRRRSKEGDKYVEKFRREAAP